MDLTLDKIVCVGIWTQHFLIQNYNIYIIVTNYVLLCRRKMATSKTLYIFFFQQNNIINKLDIQGGPFFYKMNTN